MNYISEIAIQNFQSHSHTILKPAEPGKLTVIVGPSDSGKTAIIRAVRWLTYNVPSGTDFIKIGTSQAKVSVTMVDGHEVTRQRSRGGINRYIVTAPDGQEQVLEGFGSIVPLEVQQTTGISSVEIGDMTINLNLSEQLDGPFLGKSISAPARAKVLGKLAGTEEIDHASKVLGTDLYRCRQEEKRLSAEIDSLTNQIEAYDYLEDLKETIDAIKAKWAEINEEFKLVQVLSELRGQRQQLFRKRDEQQEVLNSLAFIETGNQLLRDTETSLSKNTVLLDLHTKLQSQQQKLQETKHILGLTTKTQDAESQLVLIGLHVERLDMASRVKEKRHSFFETLAKANLILDKTNQINEAVETIEGLSRKNVNLDTVQGCLNRRSRIAMALEESRQVLKATEQLSTAETLSNQLQENRILKLKCADLSGRLRTHSILKQKYGQETEKYAQEVSKCQEEYISYLMQVGMCPTCGSTVNTQAIKEVV